MIGSFLTRALVMVFGYAYPAYECYKTVEKNKPEIDQLRFWCQYWILVAVLTVSERIGDTFISWVPMYSEAKLAFFIYLWYPKTKGTTFVYDSFFRPYVAKHETEIDRNLLELKTRSGDIAVLYWQKAASYGQTRVFEILKFVASQSTPRPRPVQVPQAARVVQNPTAPSLKAPTSTTEPEVQESPSPAPSATAAASSSARNSVGLKEVTAEMQSNSMTETKGTAMEKETASSASEETADSMPHMEEPSRVTRLRLRKTRSATMR